MKLYQEFKSINHEFPKAPIFIDENDNLEILKDKAIKIGKQLNPNFENCTSWSHSDTSSIVAIFKIDDKSELVIRR